MVLIKIYNKKNVIRVFGFKSSKVIFILLTEIKLFYMAFIIIYIEKLSFSRFILRFFGG